MRTNVFAVLPLVFACCSGCVRHTTLIGTYRASYPNSVTESIELWRDGTYQQDISDKSGKTIEHMGQWRMGRQEQVEVPGWMDPNSIAFGKQNAGTSRPEVIFVAPLADFRKPGKPINMTY